MLLTPGATRCPACGRFVYATEPLFVAENWKGVEVIRGFTPGIYHDACFEGWPHRDAYLAVDRAVQNARLDAADEYLLVLGRTPRLALSLRPVGEDYQLMFLARGRALRFRGPARWQAFLDRVGAPDGPTPTPTADRGDLRVRRTQNGWELATRQTTPILAEFARVDLDRLRAHFAARGVDPDRARADLGAACAELGIAPKSAGAVAHLVGTFAWPEAGADAADSVTLTVKVDTWNAVGLTGQEMDELRAFLRSPGPR